MTKKKSKVIAGILAVLILASTLFYLTNRPPSLAYLKAHPEELDFNKYSDAAKINHVLSVLFPIGTPKEKIDAYFIGNFSLAATDPWHRPKAGVMEFGASGDHYNVTYVYRRNKVSGYFVVAEFSLDGKLMKPISFEYFHLKSAYAKGMLHLLYATMEKKQ